MMTIMYDDAADADEEELNKDSDTYSNDNLLILIIESLLRGLDCT